MYKNGYNTLNKEGGCNMPKVGIVMGSDSDLKVMSKAAKTLEKFGIDYEMTIISAHRKPDVFFEWAKGAEDRGRESNHCRSRHGSTSTRNVRSIIPDAGCRSTSLRQKLDGMDAVFSIVQMPPGVPVATVAIDGGMNAAIMAAKDSGSFRCRIT